MFSARYHRRANWLCHVPGRSAAALALALPVLLAAGCSDTARNSYQGFAEGEFVFVASPIAGNLEKLAIARGQTVGKDAPLFELEHASESAAVAEARARLGTAEARLANLEAARRKPELDALRAQVASAITARELSAIQLRQQEQLFAKGFVAQSRLDEAKAAHERDLARIAEAEAQLSNARQSIGREAEIRAARAEIEAARAELAQNEWRLGQKSAAAPADAYVQDTFFVQGEWVPAGAPIVSLLPPGNIKLRFFVPETVVGSIKAGQPVSVHCDGCGAPIPATVSFVSTQNEFTPPVIYSREARAKLVFLVEAKPQPGDATRLHPGQPVDVTFSP
ncbi:MAG TPA: HlyD family efflux transporter periplasmic adaptor subunit [Burkholderiales bacterium]|nr:HlyD family efflux transporter periplasmic adaptor subunit [Burkholderiales bacterium]